MQEGTKFFRTIYRNGELKTTEVLTHVGINSTNDAFIFNNLNDPDTPIEMSKDVFFKQLSAHGWQVKTNLDETYVYRLNLDVKFVPNRLRVVHYPQIPCSHPFIVEVKDEFEAKKIVDTLADQHLHLFEHNFIPDYSNIISVQMWDDTLDPDEDGEKWCDYWNEEEMMEWEEFEEEYLF